MTSSESKAREMIKKLYPTGLIYKIPDFKTMGLSGLKGFPDYMILFEGSTIWYEIKSVKGCLLSHLDFTEAQIIMFPRILKQGIPINMIVFYKGGYKMFSLPNTFDSTFSLRLE
jgi:hypothetical protein